MIRKFALALGACVAFAGSAHAAATPVYTSTAFSNITHPTINAWCSECGGTQKIVDAFQLSSATTLGGANTAIQSNYGANWHITVSLYDSSFTVIDSATFAPGSYSLTGLANNVSEVKFDLPDWSVGAGNYFIGFSDVNLGAPGYAVDGPELQYNLASRSSVGTSAALQLTSAVPEGTNLALMLAGLGALGVALRRRRA